MEHEGFAGFHEGGGRGDGDDLAEHDIAELDVERGGKEAASGEDAQEPRVRHRPRRNRRFVRLGPG